MKGELSPKLRATEAKSTASQAVGQRLPYQEMENSYGKVVGVRGSLAKPLDGIMPSGDS